MWKFSSHIKKRMEEREISNKEILSIVNHEVSVMLEPSLVEENVDLYFGKAGGKHWLVVANRVTKTLITVRRMREKETVIYDREVENGEK